MAASAALVAAFVAAEVFRPELGHCRDTIMIQAACAAPRANGFLVAAAGLTVGAATSALSTLLLKRKR